jgi:site-specific DNA-methyltransferase (adenine-specific)
MGVLITPNYQRCGATLYLGDCREVLATLDAESIDAVVCDPPYGLKFMGNDWDHSVPGIGFWTRALRVAKPGAHLLAFGGTRTFHRLAVAIEDAGWQIRDCVMWVYGTGFAKMGDVGKQIDKAAGAKREVVGTKCGQPGYSLAHQGAGGIFCGRADGSLDNSEGECAITTPATPEAAKWTGWSAGLKPAWEPIILARKPLAGIIAQNVLKYGTGAMNIDGCRIEAVGPDGGWGANQESSIGYGGNEPMGYRTEKHPLGRWPANVIHDGSEEVVEWFPSGGGHSPGEQPKASTNKGKRNFVVGPHVPYHFGDRGSAARFFYCAKASSKERDEGCERLEESMRGTYGDIGPDDNAKPNKQIPVLCKNNHPTVKPLALMRYLCRLITPPSGIVLDPFMGSGSTGKAALREGFRFCGIEVDDEAFGTAVKRIEYDVKRAKMYELRRLKNGRK